MLEKHAEAAYAAVKANAALSEAWLRIQKTPERDRTSPQAEKVVLDCLRALQAIPEADRQGADVLMDLIAALYMMSSPDIPTERRRGFDLLRIAGRHAA